MIERLIRDITKFENIRDNHHNVRDGAKMSETAPQNVREKEK